MLVGLFVLGGEWEYGQVEKQAFQALHDASSGSQSSTLNSQRLRANVRFKPGTFTTKISAAAM